MSEKKVLAKILNIEIITVVDVNATMEDDEVKSIYEKIENFVYEELEQGEIQHIDDTSFIVSARFEEILDEEDK